MIYSRYNKKGKYYYNFSYSFISLISVDEFSRVYLRRHLVADAWVILYYLALTRLIEYYYYINIYFIFNTFLYLYKYLFKEANKTKFIIIEVISRDKFKDYL